MTPAVSSSVTTRMTIAVMARAPIAGHGKTRLLKAHSPEWVVSLQRAMLEDTLERLVDLPATTRTVLVAPVAGLDARDIVRPLVPDRWSIALQEGDDLGARLTSATTQLFTRDPDARVVIVGGDCPHLPLFDPTLGEDVLVGPSDDGGYYLVAPRVAEPGIFRDIPWSTPQVFAVTTRRCAELGLSLRELGRSYDIDEPPDVVRLAGDLRIAPERAPRTARLLRA